MGTGNIESYDDLMQELDIAKNTLVSLNENIRRIIGRNPREVRIDKHKAPIESKRIDGDRQGYKVNESMKFKKRANEAKSIFNRLSAPKERSVDDETTKPRLNSRVIRELPTRQEIVAAQGADSESRARNRRMFGSLLGTLHKFCQEESRLKQKEEKKAQIEKKLEEQELHERETLKRERESLFMDRKKKQLEIRKLELKMSRLKDFQVWESSMTQLKHSIRTKTKPHIFFQPRNVSKAVEKLISESRAHTNSVIERKREALYKELSDLENDFRMNDADRDDHFEMISGGLNCNIGDENRQNIVLDSEEAHSKSNNDSLRIEEVKLKSGKTASKENMNGPVISSSVIVVKKSQKEINKSQ